MTGLAPAAEEGRERVMPTAEQAFWANARVAENSVRVVVGTAIVEEMLTCIVGRAASGRDLTLKSRQKRRRAAETAVV